MMRLLNIIILVLEVNSLKNQGDTDLVKVFLQENHVKYCYFLVCWPNTVKVKMSKIIINEGMDIRTTFLPVKERSVSNSDTTGYSKVSYILDLSCESASAVLRESSVTFKFFFTNSWLILANSNTSLDDIKKFFETIELRLDMDVKIALPNDNNGSSYDIYEIYDPGLEVDYKLNKVGFFENGRISYFTKNTFFQARRNMSGVLIRNANVVNFTAELLWKNRNLATYKERGGLLTLYLHYLFQPFAEMLQFRQNTTIGYPWFGPSENGTDGGLGKLLYERKVDTQIAGGSLLIKRIPHFETLVIPYMRVKTLFFYRSPGIKKPGAQVMKPLEPEVWYCTLATLIIMAAAVRAIYWIEIRFLNSGETYNLFTSVMTMIDVLTQQGSSDTPERISGRIVFLNSLIFSIWIYNYYTSGLVSSLLNSKPQMLTSYQDLYESPLAIGIENQQYFHFFFWTTNIYYLKKIYGKIEQGQGLHCANCLSAQDGLEKVRKSGFAFHALMYTAYPIISSTFDQDAICDLGEIEAFDNEGVIYISKKSQYKELFRIGLAKMRENGISKRVYDSLGITKPECRSSSLMRAVGPQELFVVYLIILVGYFLAVVSLIGEIIYRKIQQRRERLVVAREHYPVTSIAKY